MYDSRIKLDINFAY